MSILDAVAERVNERKNAEKAFLLVITAISGAQYRGTVVGHFQRPVRSETVEIRLWPSRDDVLNQGVVDGPTDDHVFVASQAIEAVEIEWLP